MKTIQMKSQELDFRLSEQIALLRLWPAVGVGSNVRVLHGRYAGRVARITALAHRHGAVHVRIGRLRRTLLASQVGGVA